MQGTSSLPPQAYTSFHVATQLRILSERSKAQKESGEQLHRSCSAQQSDSELDLSSPGVRGGCREHPHPSRHWRFSSQYYPLNSHSLALLLYPDVL